MTMLTTLQQVYKPTKKLNHAHLEIPNYILQKSHRPKDLLFPKSCKNIYEISLVP
jgi:hypothetical protein